MVMLVPGVKLLAVQLIVSPCAGVVSETEAVGVLLAVVVVVGVVLAVELLTGDELLRTSMWSELRPTNCYSTNCYSTNSQSSSRCT